MDGEKFKYATTAVAGQDIIDVRPYACFFSFLSVPTTHRVVFMYLYTLNVFLLSFSIYKYVVLPPLFHTFHPIPLSDGCSFVSASFLHAFFCLVCVTLPSFSSFSLYVVPSFCRFLSSSSYLSALNSYPQTGLCR